MNVAMRENEVLQKEMLKLLTDERSKKLDTEDEANQFDKSKKKVNNEMLNICIM